MKLQKLKKLQIQNQQNNKKVKEEVLSKVLLFCMIIKRGGNFPPRFKGLCTKNNCTFSAIEEHNLLNTVAKPESLCRQLSLGHKDGVDIAPQGGKEAVADVITVGFFHVVLIHFVNPLYIVFSYH